MENNLLLSLALDSDSYKFSHYLQYPPHTTGMSSYFESRGGKYDYTVFFGLQYYLKKYLSKPITIENVAEARDFAKAHGVPFNYEGWMHIVDAHQGYLPVRIKAVPEGSVVPTGNILLSVESTDPKVFWIVSWLETLLVRLWYPITVATQSYSIKQYIRKVLSVTSDNPEAELPFKLHDFGSRGVSSQESAMIGGAAHLVNFLGSDTVAGIWMANQYYDSRMAGYSIPAAEHSTVTMWGKANEAVAYANMLDQYKDSPIIAVVSDSYDIYNAVSNIWGGSLKDKVLNFKGTLVVRPDSGDPATVVLEVLNRLELAFGSTKNAKGYKVINNNVRVIQGDGINEESIKAICQNFIQAGFSMTNVAFGMGGALLQQVNRDTQKFAFKCSWAEVNGVGVDVFKEPATDSGKNSKRGLLDLSLEDNHEVRTVPFPAARSVMETVFVNGKIFVSRKLDEIRARTQEPFQKHTGFYRVYSPV